MSVTFPRGFRASGVVAGMKPSRRRDLGLLVVDAEASTAGLFTTNAFAAAPVELARKRIVGGSARAVVVNSGQANAGTGSRGLEDAERTTQEVATALGLEPDGVIPCSTGVIGEPIHVEEYLAALPELTRGLSEHGGEAFAQAIMTTDTVPKTAAAERDGVRVGACAKGVGMIAPDLRLATMLAFVTTDARVATEHVRRLASEVLEPRFESLSVDGCTSTNDTVLLLASGATRGEPVAPGTSAWTALTDALVEVADSLLQQLARDAEGGHHVVLITVEGAETEADARRAAKAIADSPLVKTAVFGGDPNPGRILQAIGSSGARFEPSRVRAWLGDVPVIEDGAIAPPYFDGAFEAAHAALAGRDVEIRVRLGDGDGSSTALGVDLSYGYVKINAEYHT